MLAYNETSWKVRLYSRHHRAGLPFLTAVVHREPVRGDIVRHATGLYVVEDTAQCILPDGSRPIAAAYRVEHVLEAQ